MKKPFPALDSNLLCWTLTSLFFTCLTQGAEIKGLVSEISDTQITIEIMDHVFPQMGDDVTIGFEAPQMGFVQLKGKWEVVGFEGQSVLAYPVTQSNQPQINQQAVILSENPQSLESIRAQAEALYLAGEDCLYGKNGHPVDLQQALNHYIEASMMGSADAMASIGYMHANGYVFETNTAEAIWYFEKASRLGSNKAKRYLEANKRVDETAKNGAVPQRTSAITQSPTPHSLAHAQPIETIDSSEISPVPPSTSQHCNIDPSQRIHSEALTETDRNIMNDLNSREDARIRHAAKLIYRGRFISPMLLEKADAVLLEQFNDAPRNSLHVDAMSWLCKALYASKDKRHLETLTTVARKARSRKLRKYAKINTRALQRAR